MAGKPFAVGTRSGRPLQAKRPSVSAQATTHADHLCQQGIGADDAPQLEVDGGVSTLRVCHEGWDVSRGMPTGREEQRLYYDLERTRCYTVVDRRR